MKTRFLGTILGIALVAIGCGGSQPSGGGPDVCAMNPIAYGCGLESVQGAVINGFKTTPSLMNPAYTYLCDGHVNDFSGTMKTDSFRQNIFVPIQWQTRFDAVNWANPLPTRNSLSPRFNTQPEIPMEPAMDGPYHVLYNTTPSLQYGLVTSATGNANAKPVIIPAYGIWIYAPNERPDYPTGAEVITFDPDPSVPFAGGDGRCSTARVQAVSKL